MSSNLSAHKEPEVKSSRRGGAGQEAGADVDDRLKESEETNGRALDFDRSRHNDSGSDPGGDDDDGAPQLKAKTACEDFAGALAQEQHIDRDAGQGAGRDAQLGGPTKQATSAPNDGTATVSAGASKDTVEPMANSAPTDLSEYMPIDAVLRLKPLFTDPLIDEGIVAYFMDLPERMLLTPLVTDAVGTTVLGQSDQQEACRRLHATDAALLQRQFPQGLWITRRPYNAAEDPLRAFSDAIADCRGRHEMKPADVKKIMEQMIGAGLVPKRGRQKKGTEPAIPFFAKLFRYSESQIKRFRRAARPEVKPAAQIDQMTSLRRFKTAIDGWTPKLKEAPDAVRQHLDGLQVALAAAFPAQPQKAKTTKKTMGAQGPALGAHGPVAPPSTKVTVETPPGNSG